MLKNLPRDSEKIFGNATYNAFKQALQQTRKRLANNLQNPRLKNNVPHIQTLEDTMLYHQTKDPYHVKQFLGHKTLKTGNLHNGGKDDVQRAQRQVHSKGGKQA